MRGGKRIRKELGAALITPGLARDSALKRALSLDASYVLSDGSTLAVNNAEYYLFDAETRNRALEAARRLAKELAADQSDDILDGYDIDERFADRVPELVGKLVAMVGPPRLRYGPTSRKRLAAFVTKRKLQFRRTGYFEPLVAYCLEATKSRTGGTIRTKWRGEVLPCVITPSGEDLLVTRSIYVMLHERGPFKLF